MFHLGWFVAGVNFSSWRNPWADIRVTDGIRMDMFVDLVRSLERAGFDYVMFEDSLQIDDQYKGSIEAFLKYGIECPRLDPTLMVAVISQQTKHIGLIPTISTSFYPPFMAARMLATLDHLSEGRVGGNLVTSSSHRAAQNFGHDEQMEHDRRYEKAGEWVEVVRQLLGSWEPGAVVLDKASHTMIDHTKVHAIDFEGEFFKCRGPLNIPPGPQGRPVFCQAGGSGAGRSFAARNVDTIVAVPLGIEAMKQYRDDISAQMIAAGRKPTDCKVIFLVRPIIAETDAIARELYEQDKAFRASDQSVDRALANMSYFAQVDFSKLDLDAPIPDLTGMVNGHQSTTNRYYKDSVINKKTLRQVAQTQDYVASIDLVGSPDSVADMMGEAMEYVGGDGFFISMLPLDRRTAATITEGLVPALRRRGLVRTHYEHKTFKENLLAF